VTNGPLPRADRWAAPCAATVRNPSFDEITGASYRPNHHGFRTDAAVDCNLQVLKEPQPSVSRLVTCVGSRAGRWRARVAVPRRAL
jgi:hypothetical protein